MTKTMIEKGPRALTPTERAAVVGGLQQTKPKGPVRPRPPGGGGDGPAS